MTLTLQISPELESQLVQAASNAGLPVDQYAIELLQSQIASSNPPKNGAELVAYWQSIGAIGSRPDIIDPVSFAREVRRNAESR
jgi:hypothetical protein